MMANSLKRMASTPLGVLCCLNIRKQIAGLMVGLKGVYDDEL